MSSPSQQQPTAEKSVQTQELTGSTTVVLTNTPITHFHPENTVTEVANTLVSMATGSQRNLNTPTSLPILSLADYTTARGVPTAMALATQAKFSPMKQDEMIDGSDDTSMSTDEHNSNRKRRKTKLTKQQEIDAIQYGPIVVKPRKSIAPTLASGRKSKDDPLPPEQDLRRRQRRDRNKEAAAKCRRRRNDLRSELEKIEKDLLNEQKLLEENVQTLSEQRSQLEVLLQRHNCSKKTRLSLPTSTSNSLNISKTDTKIIPSTNLLDSNNNNGNSKRLTINIANAQDLFTVTPLTRVTPTLTTTADGLSSSNVPMITIHILPEFAQALLNSASVDRAKLTEFLQQAAVAGDSSTPSESMNSTS